MIAAGRGRPWDSAADTIPRDLRGPRKHDRAACAEVHRPFASVAEPAPSVGAGARSGRPLRLGATPPKMPPTDIETLWQHVSEDVREAIGDSSHAIWIGTMTPLGFDGHELVV